MEKLIIFLIRIYKFSFREVSGNVRTIICLMIGSARNLNSSIQKGNVIF